MQVRTRMILMSFAFTVFAGLVRPSMLDVSTAKAFTPYDPVVQGMIERGMQYLETEATGDGQSAATPFGRGVGQRALVGYAHFKINGDPTAAPVKRGIAAVLQSLERADSDQLADVSHNNKSLYGITVSILLLCDVGPSDYESEIKQLFRLMETYRRSDGSYTYPSEEKGDTSQTQYAILALWTMDKNEFSVDLKKIAQTIGWLTRVQDPEGGWPYHGVDPGSGKVRQSGLSTSTTLAAGSALLIAGDVLKTFGDSAAKERTEEEGLPKALRTYRGEDYEKKQRKAKVSIGTILGPIQAAEKYRSNNPYSRQTRRGGYDWYYYQIYTLERYESFAEIARGTKPQKSPGWYNQVVAELKENQDPSGGWSVNSDDISATSGPEATSFALLFLIRSTQKAINAFSGTLAGGRSLPKDTTDIRVDGSQIKGRPIAMAVTEMLDILEADGDKLDGQSLPEDLQLAGDPKDRSAQLDRLERLVRGSTSYQARAVAARLLGTSDELRVVPSLIVALSDDDIFVRRYARDGLRFISRQFDGFGMPDKPTSDERIAAQRAWKQWYKKMDPNYVFLDDRLR